MARPRAVSLVCTPKPLVLLSAALTLASSGCDRAEPDRPPSVILISLDTLRADHVGFLGYERDTTPNLDALAEECVVYERAYATASWTLISHMTMLTGLYPDEHGVVTVKHALSPDVPLLAERLRDHGYQTVAFYKPGFIGERYGFDRGFDAFRPHERAPEADRHVRNTLRRLNRGRPFFMFIHLFDIHTADLKADGATFYDPPPPYDRAFLPDAPDRLAGVDCHAAWFDEASLTPEQIEAMVALYDGGIRYVDHVLGEWLATWRRDGLLDESILIVTSDHGESLGQRDRIRGHGGMFEEGLRALLLIRFPDGSRAGERVATPVSHVDLVPTLLAAVGLQPDPWLPGHSLLDPPPENSVLLAHRPSIDVTIAWPWKVIEHNRDGGYSGTAVNLVVDPLELQPIRSDRPEFEEILARLRGRKEEFLGGRPELPGTAVPASSHGKDELQAMRKLGYLGDS